MVTLYQSYHSVVHFRQRFVRRNTKRICCVLIDKFRVSKPEKVGQDIYAKPITNSTTAGAGAET